MIQFKDLSGALKVAVVFAYISGAIITLNFIAGFLFGFFSA